MDPNSILAASENISNSLIAIADILTEAKSGLINETALYYTFSTIAQTLAGAFAILGAFVMFKFQNIIRSFRKMGELLNRVYFAFNNSIPDSYHLENWEAYIIEMKDCYEKKYLHYTATLTGYISKDEYNKYLGTFEKNLYLKKAITSQLGFAFYVTASTIMLSLISLPLVPKYANTITMFISLVFSILLSLICILLYGSLLFTALEITWPLTKYILKVIDIIRGFSRIFLKDRLKKLRKNNKGIVN